MDQIYPRKVSSSWKQSKTDKIDTTIEFCQICIKFHFEQTIFNFWTKFSQERYLWSKTEKLEIIIEFCLFKLVLVPNFSSNWQFLLFGSSLHKRYFQSKTEKVNIIEFRIFKLVSWYQISALTNNFDFFDQIFPERDFLV